MEEYKNHLKNQNKFLSVSIAVLALLTILGFVAEAGLVALTPFAGDSHWQSMWRGFLSGASMGVMALMIYGLVCNLRALKDSAKLKKQYIKEHDERSIQIWTAARASSMQVFLTGGLIAGIVAGYFNVTVSITLLACVTVHAFLGLGFKFYYSRKY